VEVTARADPLLVAPARNGLGLKAARSFDRCETLIKLEGRVVHHGLLWRRQGSRFSANCIRFGPETYLDPRDGFGAYLNHSCAPNAGIRKSRNQLFLFAARRISAGSEIVIDYSTTIGDDDIWTMRCRCGSDECRRIIRNFGSLTEDLRRRYLRMGLVPPYIVRTLTERIVLEA
jgi:hypothetical protein